MSQFQDEQCALEDILKKLTQSYKQVSQKIAGYHDEYTSLKKYMVDYTAEMDKMEIFSHQQMLHTIDRTGVVVLNRKTKLEKLLESAYFGRIDFVYVGETAEDAEIFYIGKFSFTDESGMICIYDWRAPVASMYYDYELGNASYESLNGVIEGELIRKRQLKVEKNKVLYVLESSMNVHDTILQEELSRTTDERMKTIITTIQKEQNAIVRNERTHTLVIQGVAGSGKTSIALHRVAYLLYKYRDKLSADRMMIVSPNQVFSDYISTVLPELGEEPILEVTLEGLARKILPAKYGFMSLHQQTRQCIEEPDCAFTDRVRLKSSLEFFHALQAYLEAKNTDILTNKSLVIQEYEVPAAYIANRFLAYSKEPIIKRLEQVAQDILAYVKAKRQGEIKLPSKNEITKRLKKRLQFDDAYNLYENFYKETEQTAYFIGKKSSLEFADVYPLIYCLHALEGVERFDFIEHLVIDEMQDYSPIQYAVIQKLFRCKKTILGDFGQSLNPFAVSHKQKLEDVFPDLEFVALRKSYRSSFEIISFAKQFLPEDSIEAVERHGETPYLHTYLNEQEQIALLKEALQKFQSSPYKTCGIICKTEAQVTTLQEALTGFPIHLIDESSSTFHMGITLCPIQLAKGLEFDSVIIPFVDDSYQSTFDRGLLYIACTRALHQLTLLISKENPSSISIQKNC